MNKITIAGLQLGTSQEGNCETLSQIISFEKDIVNCGAKLVVMPEALLGGYPKGGIFGTYMGYRLPEGKVEFEEYYKNAIDLNGPEVKALAELSKRTQASLVVGVIEREGSTLYCSALFFDPKIGLCKKHRKLMPTGTERLVWGMGDGSTLSVFETEAGLAGAGICWENFMPLFRTAMYAKGLKIWCAPTVDERDMWQASMRHIAYEGRCFVISACQVQASPNELGIDIPHWDPDRALIRGGSLIVNPMGDIIAGPLYSEKGLVVADIDPGDLIRARYDFDVVGHYSRPDIFSLKVNENVQKSVVFYSKENDKIDGGCG